MSPGDLDQLLSGLPFLSDSNLLVGTGNCDDAGVYRLNDETALIQTVDFFTPIVDDPYRFGQITAANALSDVYAMGGKPLLAMNLVCFPEKMDRIILKKIISGGLDKLNEAGALLVGGHSIEDEELKYGLSVTGTVHPDKVLLNSGAKPGDKLLITKPLGIGVLSTAIKGDLAGEETEEEITEVMVTLNKLAAEVMNGHEVHACTDITGFGLLGHLHEMMHGAHCSATIKASSVPLINGAEKFASMGIIPEGAHKNKSFYKKWIKSNLPENDPLEIILYDPQTSGGLLIAAPGDSIQKIQSKLSDSEYPLQTAVIGEIIDAGPARIIVK